jgi:glycosyltransferase involved in cell wall biosynthesis
MELPSVAILLPVYNEVESIDECLESLAAQDYQGRMEIVVADGGSTDGTLDRIEEWRSRLPALRVLDNPKRLQSHALNLAATSADADIVVRADAHTTYARDYVRRSVEALLSTGADAVGGPMVPRGNTSFSRAVQRAFRSRIGIGPAVFHHADKPAQVDTVYLGAMRRSTWIGNGGIRTLPSGVAEDADFYYRLRKRGGKVMIDPAIVSSYQPRGTVAGLWRQFYRYGLGKADMYMINGEFPSWRPLAPLALVVGLTVGAVFAAFGNPLLLVIGLAVWLLVILIGSGLNPAVMLAIAVMHFAYGLGLIRGLLRRPSRVRSAIS